MRRNEEMFSKRYLPVLLILIMLFSALNGCAPHANVAHAGTGEISETAAIGDIDSGGGTPGDAASPDRAFSNSDPSEEAQPVSTFLFFSDIQADPETGEYLEFGELLTKALSQTARPELVIFGGDSVNDGGDADEWNRLKLVSEPLLSGLTTASAAGNHDRYDLLRLQFDYPGNNQGQGHGFFYSIAAESVFFIVLDSNIMGAANQEDVEWLRNELQSDDAKRAAWRVVVMHHPMWTVVDNPKDEQRAEVMRGAFLSLFEEYGVSLILCGHEHMYSRTMPMSGGATADDWYPEVLSESNDGIVQIMAASGGKESYRSGERGYIAAEGEAPNYLVIKARRNELTVSAYDANQTEFDSVTFTRAESEPPAHSVSSPLTGSPRVTVIGAAGGEIWSFSEETIRGLSADQVDAFVHVYSTINNWPAVRFYAAEGYKVETLLAEAGVLETVQTVTFRAEDGYEVSLTREQLLSKQYFYPHAGEDGEGAEQVYPIIAFRWKEGTEDVGAIRDDKPLLIFGQRDYSEHTNPAFVVGVSEIIVNTEPCERWPAASAFPLPGPIAKGETVKLQHPNYGLVKLHYTLDGSDPTMRSPLYNISTYQPELNKPILINESTVIKVLATGYGRDDSEIAVLEFTAVG